MLVKQVSVFLQNKSGRLAEVSRILGQKEIDIRALSIADTAEYGILRLIVNKPEEAVDALTEHGFSVRTTDVIAIAISDQPGGLSRPLEILERNQIGIEYTYAFLGHKSAGKAIVILRVEETKKAIEILVQEGIEIMPSKEIYQL
ncbi:MAG TPA: acetolactate synthase [Ruminiclostridium sp.]|jgi:hypothetical protein|nr:acetolactate synthase [Ruminiclostridium sp.]